MWKGSDVNGQVGALTTAITIGEGRDLEAVTVTMWIESRTEELQATAGPAPGLLHMAAVVRDFPEQSAVLASREFLHATPQLPQLKSLPIYHSTQ